MSNFSRKISVNLGIRVRDDGPKPAKPASKRPLESLPAEILAMILSCLPASSILNVARTNKAFQKHAETALYRDIRLTFCCRNGYNRDVALLFRALSKRPVLGLYVRRFDFVYRRAKHSRPFNKCPTVMQHLPLVEQYVRMTGLRPVSLWQNGLSTRCIETVSALILGLIPGVQELRLEQSMLSEPSLFLISALRNAYENPPWEPEPAPEPFSQLRSLEIDSDSSCTGWTAQTLAQMRELVSLDSLRIFRGAVSDSTMLNMPANAGIYLPFTEIYCRMKMQNSLGQLLSFAPDVRVLEYTHRQHHDCAFRFDHLHAALTHVKPQLEKLVVTGPACTRSAHESRGVLRGKFGSLRDYLHLTHLELPWAMLTEDAAGCAGPLKDILPRALKVLVLNDYLAFRVTEGGAKPAARAYMFGDFLGRDWREYVPDLERIVVKVTWDNHWNKAAVDAMRDVCSLAGVRFVVDVDGFPCPF
ncbi:hypothetical protein AJ80_07732 [Polytolypa hystricis UAMH7299]|uniref:F-box domain-containing protein n=1 Tax=Polytolypa hystricis (strain UAMH7299) TaxID=1447883 RepID=A0A2B7XJK9_POLH7|nr:hypothetical protein AJ80_07732 [Polytolypa hystricis UAMH7299]